MSGQHMNTFVDSCPYFGDTSPCSLPRSGRIAVSTIYLCIKTYHHDIKTIDRSSCSRIGLPADDGAGEHLPERGLELPSRQDREASLRPRRFLQKRLPGKRLRQHRSALELGGARLRRTRLQRFQERRGEHGLLPSRVQDTRRHGRQTPASQLRRRLGGSRRMAQR